MANNQMVPTAADWDARVAAWQTRVHHLGVERSIYHMKHQAPEFPAVTALQHHAIWPAFLAALTDQDRRVLDFGCGYGRWTAALAEATGYALGVDPTPELLAHAQTRPQPATGIVEFRPYRRGRIPAEDHSFDVLWSCMVLSTVLDPGMFAATLTELCRVMRPSGLVFVIDNTSREDGSAVRGRYSMSRTITEYQEAFAPWAVIRPVSAYVDLGEINTVFSGRVHA